jgi:hypothetical protein
MWLRPAARAVYGAINDKTQAAVVFIFRVRDVRRNRREDHTRAQCARHDLAHVSRHRFTLIDQEAQSMHDLIVVGFRGKDRATEVLAELLQLAYDGTIDLFDGVAACLTAQRARSS